MVKGGKSIGGRRPSDLGLVEQTLRNWVKRRQGQAAQAGAKDDDPRADGALAAAGRELARLKLEVEILKKATAYFAKDAL